MTTAYDVPAELLIRKTADKLMKLENCKAPEWAPFVKTGIHKEKAPLEKDWWPKPFIRNQDETINLLFQ